MKVRSVSVKRQDPSRFDDQSGSNEVHDFDWLVRRVKCDWTFVPAPNRVASTFGSMAPNVRRARKM
jgi:hypothetical protein